ncbi:hypothetical protein [Rhizobium ruizarguesonis]|jgi:hypothetical protein|uniref:hypothetical protein n=1 Tax=Rhizobium ruizarguesonis TaxID=2081791 RepID=UPI001FE143F7|nr:hypothetical protein [Rhizobium ruizarguesonis]
MKERKLALVAKERPKELLAARGLKVMVRGMDLRMQGNEGCVMKAPMDTFHRRRKLSER